MDFFDTMILILVIILVIFILGIIYIIYRLGVGSNEIKLFDDIENKSADLIADLYKNKDDSDYINNLKAKSVEIEKLLVDTAQFKFELIQKHNIDRVKLVLTIFAVIVTIIGALSTYKNYLSMSAKDRKENLDKQFIELTQKISSDNEESKEIAIITLPRFAIPYISKYQKTPKFDKEYDNYDTFLSDFIQKYPYVSESNAIIVNELERIAIKRTKKKCKTNNNFNNCESIEELYDYFSPPFTGTIYSNSIISSLSSITKNTLQKDIILKSEVKDIYPYKRERISAVDLREKDFRGSYLRNVNFEGGNCERVNFSFANLSGANLNHSYLKNAVIVDTNLRYANLVHSFLASSFIKGADFTGSNLEGADFRNAVLIECIFRNASMVNTKFNNALIYKSKFFGEPFKISKKSLDELIKINSITPKASANFLDVRIGNKIETLPDFNNAIIDYENYTKLDFLNQNYTSKIITEKEIVGVGYNYAVKNYLIHEIKDGQKILRLKKIDKNTKPFFTFP